MRLLFSNGSLVLNNVAYPNFPIILNSDGSVFHVASFFLIEHCIVRGRVQSSNTWAAYGQAIYDYTSFLEGCGKSYLDFLYDENHSIVAAYRDWSLNILSLSPNTVNLRLKIVIKFYKYLRQKKYIEELPFDLETINVPRDRGLLSHLQKKVRTIQSHNVLLKEKHIPVRFLSSQQARLLIERTAFNPTLNCMIRLALCTGLRRSEIMTFPLEYIVDPFIEVGDRPKNYRLHLESQKMSLKGGRSRSIDISENMMHYLWSYKSVYRQADRDSEQADGVHRLFLTRFGVPFSIRSKIINSAISKYLNITSGCHILRHTYATFKLYHLTKIKCDFDPLLYVRDRLGHSSITTTEKYLHCLSSIEIQTMDQIGEEIFEL